MKNPLKEWLPQRVIAPGVIASGLRRPNDRVVAQCADPVCPPAAMENLLRQLDTTRLLFAQDDPPPRWVTFSFEQGLIRFVVRPDGWQFAMLARPETEAARQMDALSVEFLALPLGK